jgi:uncharacterized protein (DUF39 family)
MAFAAAAMLSAPMVATPAETMAAKQDADGLVVVQIGDSLNNNQVLPIAVAAQAIVVACDVVDANLNVGVVSDLLFSIDNQEIKNFTFCKAEGGKVKAKNNNN